jgi:hypothetical protein
LTSWSGSSDSRAFADAGRVRGHPPSGGGGEPDRLGGLEPFHVEHVTVVEDAEMTGLVVPPDEMAKDRRGEPQQTGAHRMRRPHLERGQSHAVAAVLVAHHEPGLLEGGQKVVHACLGQLGHVVQFAERHRRRAGRDGSEQGERPLDGADSSHKRTLFESWRDRRTPHVVEPRTTSSPVTNSTPE